jgi:hypothetical protein
MAFNDSAKETVDFNYWLDSQSHRNNVVLWTSCFTGWCGTGSNSRNPATCAHRLVSCGTTAERQGSKSCQRSIRRFTSRLDMAAVLT